jgi:hypothetical protein
VFETSLLNREQMRRGNRTGSIPVYLRWVARAIVAGAVAASILALLSAIPAVLIRDDLEAGKTSLLQARSALIAGDFREAERSFSRAARSFDRARTNPTTFLLATGAAVPVLGRTPGALRTLTTIGREASAAGLEASRALAALPGGIGSLGLSGGRIPIDTLEGLAPALHRARLAVDRAAGAAARLPTAWIPSSVGRAGEEARAELDRLVPLARSADAMLSSLPAFAGQDRPTRYFVAAQNSAELRGTGGLIGNFAILTIDHGTISLGPFQDIHDLPNLPSDELPAPSPDFRALYGPFDGLGFWRNLNMTPDAPTAGQLIESLYERVRGERLDGTIFVNLQGLADLLEVTGPIDVLGHRLDASNVVRFVADADYAHLPGPDPYDLVPRLVAQTAWAAFLANSDPDLALRGLVGAVTRGDLVVHSSHPEMQRAFVEAGAAGSFGTSRGDFLSVVLQNAAANKVDYFIHEHVRYEIALGEHGTGTARLEVAMSNDAPAGAPPSYALGPSSIPAVQRLGLQPGESRSWSAFYCSSACRLESSAVDGQPHDFGAYREKGLWLYGDYLNIRPQQTKTVHLRLGLEGVWTGDQAAGTYRLRLQGQHAINPAEVEVVVRVPDGMHVAWTSVPMRLEGNTATWQGNLSDVRDLEVRFERHFLGRIVARVWGFLSKPVFHL